MVRVKHRYLVAQILFPETPASSAKASNSTSTPALEFHRPTPDDIQAKHLMFLLRATIAELFGDYGAGAAAGSLTIKYFSPATSTLIIRCLRDKARLVWSALTFITHLPAIVDGQVRAGRKGVPCVVRVVHHSGTIRKSEEKIIELARQDIVRMKMLEANDEDAVERMLGMQQIRVRLENIEGLEFSDVEEDEGEQDDLGSE